MKDQDKTREELVAELLEMREKTAELETSLITLKRREDAGQEAQAAYISMIEAFDGLIYVCSSNYDIQFMNDRFIQRTGHNPAGEKCYRALHDRDEICPWCVNEKIQLGETVRWEVRSPKDSRWYSVVNTPVRHPDGTISKMSLIQDITDRKRSENVLLARLRLVEYSTSHSLDELLQATLDEVEALTDSSIGFYHFLDSDQKTLHLQAWSTRTLREMCTAEGRGLHYNIDEAGVWADCVRERKPVIHNDYSALPHRRSMPSGHVDVIRELVVPVFRGDRIVAILGVGNKPVDYDASDIETVSLLADLAWDIAERKKAEEALWESEERYRSVYDTAPLAFVLWDRETKVTDWNDQAERLFGWKREEIIGQNFFDYIIPESARIQVRTIVELLLEGKLPSHSINENVTKSGQIIVCEWNNTITRDSEGNVTGVISLALDITERKRVEAELRESEERFRCMFEHSLDAVFLTAPDGRIFKANPAACQMLGRSEEEICQLGRSGLVDTNDPAYNVFLGERKRTGNWKGELNHKRRDGTLFPAEISSAVFSTALGEERTSLVIRDISERNRVDLSLRLSEQKFRNLTESTCDWILEMDPLGTITYASPQVKEMLGYLPEEILGKRSLDLCPPEEKKRLMPFVKRIAKTPEPFSGLEGKAAHEDGHLVHIEASGAPVWGLDGELAGFLCVYRDITERKKAEQALREAHDELERRVEERTREINQINENLLREIAERKQTEIALRRSEELFRAIFESAQDAIIIKDMASRYVKVNPAVERVLGLPASKIIGRRAEDLVDARSARATDEYEARILAGETVEAERAIAVRGGTIVLHSIGVPLKDLDGAITGICTISRDVTERKLARELPQVDSHGYRSKPMQATLRAMGHASASDVIVLLQGESGSGKDYAARRIHDRSNRAGGPFFSINCAALPHELAESELFGHEAGAFTGAVKCKKGLLELAEGGTLLLNEIGELSMTLQSKLLSFLDTRSFLRVGGEKSITVSARLMAATHRDLEAEADEGRFLRPLYYRLSVFSIHIPPLRERPEDIPSIAEDLMAYLAREMQLSEIPVIEPVDMRALQRYHWPGNIREIRNVLERALIVCRKGPFRLSLPALEQAAEHWSHTVRLSPGQTLRDVTDEVTQGLCIEALRLSQGSKTAAARMLGISRDSMYRHMKRFGLESENQTKG